VRIAALVVSCSSPVVADDVPATRPALVTLEQLNRETQALYQSLQGSVLRVQLPSPRSINNTVAQTDNDKRWDRYPQLSPEVRKALDRRGNKGGSYTANGATSQPAGNTTITNGNYGNSGNYGGGNGGQQPGQNTAQPQQQQVQQQQIQQPVQQQRSADRVGQTPGTPNGDNNSRQQGMTIVVPPPQNGSNPDNPYENRVGNNYNFNSKAGPAFVANNFGLLLNDKGHVLVPVYVDRESIGDQPVKLAIGDADMVDARLIGSDQPTQLSVLQLLSPAAQVAENQQVKAKVAEVEPAGNKPEKSRETSKSLADALPALGKALRFSDKKLPEGSVVLLLSPTNSSGSLVVWNAASREAGGVVVTIDGEIAGIARNGQFLRGLDCQSVAEQIIRHGAAKHATLGVIVTPVEPGKSGLAVPEEFADKATLRIDQVSKGSVAEQGGVRPGDFILAVGSESVRDIPTLSAAIATREGETKLKVLRDGKVVTVTVNLVQR